MNYERRTGSFDPSAGSGQTKLRAGFRTVMNIVTERTSVPQQKFNRIANAGNKKILTKKRIEE